MGASVGGKRKIFRACFARKTKNKKNAREKEDVGLESEVHASDNHGAAADEQDLAGAVGGLSHALRLDGTEDEDSVAAQHAHVEAGAAEVPEEEGGCEDAAGEEDVTGHHEHIPADGDLVREGQEEGGFSEVAAEGDRARPSRRRARRR